MSLVGVSMSRDTLRGATTQTCPSRSAERARRWLQRGVPTLLVATTVSLGPALSSQAAQPETEGVSIREVDLSAFPEVRLVVQTIGPEPSLDDFRLEENGEPVDDATWAPIDASRNPSAIVLTIDTSFSMSRGDAIEQAKTAAREFVTALAGIDRIAIVAFSTEPREVIGFTSDPDELLAAIDTLAAGGRTALWDAVVMASQLVSTQEDVQRFLVVLSDADEDSFDNASESTDDDARSAAIAADATVYTIALPVGPVDESVYRSLADATGGFHLTASDPSEVSAVFGEVQGSIRAQYEVTYTSSATTRTLDLLVGVGDAETATQVAVPETDETGETAEPDDGAADDEGAAEPLVDTGPLASPEPSAPRIPSIVLWALGALALGLLVYTRRAARRSRPSWTRNLPRDR